MALISLAIIFVYFVAKEYIGHRSNSGIQGLRNLGIEGILSVLIDLFYPLIPQWLNPLILR
jgi:hypothetical protein